MTLKRHVSACVALVLVFPAMLFIPIASYASVCVHSSKQSMSVAAEILLNGPRNTRICVGGHEVLVSRPASIVRAVNGKIVLITGTMRRAIAWLPDDVITYTVRYDDGVPDWKNAELHFDRGGITGIFKSTISFAGQILLALFNQESRIENVRDALESLTEDHGWQAQITAIVVYAAIYAETPRDLGSVPAKATAIDGAMTL